MLVPSAVVAQDRGIAVVAPTSDSTTCMQSAADPDASIPACTRLIDSETGDARYCILKNITSETRLARQREFATARPDSLRATYSPAGADAGNREPFALLHRSR